MTFRVLVVDDEPAIRHALGRLFRREGWEAVTAATAGEAIAALELSPVAAIVLDYHLPGMSGGELGAEVAARWPDLARRIMFVSGDPQLTPDTLPSACRGARLMAKPFDLLEMVAAVRALLPASSPGPAAGGPPA
ncbi:MAG TPA: response regulator [Gemmatimonadales bacterium]|nr:response regulator [Gemmatimonadales bacterium]